MKAVWKLILPAVVAVLSTSENHAQGTFQNLDFESGVFVPIPGDPYGRVEFAPAMPGWTGYLGAVQINWILHNNIFLSDAGIAIFGPDHPSPDLLQGLYFVSLQDSFPVPATVPALAQVGTIPVATQSLLFYTLDSNPFIGVSFAGQTVPVVRLSGSSGTNWVWGGDISAFAGQTGELRLFGNGYLDHIQFSNQPIPEPNTFGSLALGALLLGWWLGRTRER